MNFYLNHCGLICAIGKDLHEAKKHLLHHAQSSITSGITWTDAYSPQQKFPVGRVQAELPAITIHQHRTRNNQMLAAALLQIRDQVNAAIQKYGSDRVGIVLGTSTTGIANTEWAVQYRHQHGHFPDDYHYAQQELSSPVDYLLAELNITGPAYVHSTACASSGKAMASAARLLKADLCDVVITGGVDTLCAFTMAGFRALESVSDEICNPFSLNRRGINIGEGAALFVMSKEKSSVALCGWGESSDAYHMSAPDPNAEGAKLAMYHAMKQAGISPQEVQYINLHGTATLQNDAMESKAVADMFGCDVPVSSTKGWTGHALGAASAIEAALCWICMQDDNPHGYLPPHLWDGVQDTQLPRLNWVRQNDHLGQTLNWCLSNSFAFGGANVALVFGRQ